MQGSVMAHTVRYRLGQVKIAKGTELKEARKGKEHKDSISAECQK